jgi:beta-lysine 5,6-aminomutase alpha subunit
MPYLPLDPAQIQKVKDSAEKIAGVIQVFIDEHSSVSTERTVLRLFGVDGVTETEEPLPNRIIDLLQDEGLLESGISRAFSAAMVRSGRDAQTTAELIDQGKIELGDLDSLLPARIEAQEQALSRQALATLDSSRRRKQTKRAKYALGPQPWKYVIVATGNIYEDRTQACSAAHSGADAIAVIRTTAQSLLDHVPYGPTTEGYGGTMATQANFRIMREALDEVSESLDRSLLLVNYSSGLCMAEIAACAAFEDLDILLNDSMYGILFRDINMQRTFIDQYFSRLICARAEIFINTGEDNYLTTADAIEQAHTVTTSQLINEAMARKAGLPESLMGLGHAFEINPEIENALLYEISHAELARSLFPEAPLKYMPATKHKSTDIFYSHAMDTVFNLVSVLTGQGIHLSGMPSEAIHTPLMMERYQALTSVNYLFRIAKDLGQEIDWKPEGFIVKRAQQVLDETEELLGEILELGGLRKAIEAGKFANILREAHGGKGVKGVFRKSTNYSNPVLDELIRGLR